MLQHTVSRSKRRNAPPTRLNDTPHKEPDMNADQMLMEIREANLSYLMLAQNLIRAQIMRVAASNTLLCRMRVDDDLVWTLLTNHGKGGNDSVTRLHANILMAGRHQEAA